MTLGDSRNPPPQISVGIWKIPRVFHDIVRSLVDISVLIPDNVQSPLHSISQIVGYLSTVPHYSCTSIHLQEQQSIPIQCVVGSQHTGELLASEALYCGWRNHPKPPVRRRSHKRRHRLGAVGSTSWVHQLHHTNLSACSQCALSSRHEVLGHRLGRYQ